MGQSSNSDFIEISGFSVTKDPQGSPMAILSTDDGRALALALTEDEAEMLATRPQDTVKPPAADLVTGMAALFDADITGAAIVEQTAQGTAAEVRVSTEAGTKTLWCSGADALAIARKTGCPIYVKRWLLDRSSATFVWDYMAVGKTSWVKSEQEWIDLKEGAEAAPIIRITNAIFLQAIRDRVPEVVVEPQDYGVVVNELVDGTWKEMLQLPRYLQAPITARLKKMAGLQPDVKNKPQKGDIPIRNDGADYRVTLTTEPTSYGENMRMRIERV